MTTLARKLAARAGGETRSIMPLDFNTWAGMVSSLTFQGQSYVLPGRSSEEIAKDYVGLARGAYKANGPVFSLIAARAMHFSEARFAYRRLRSGRTGDIFGDQTLRILEKPWPNGTTRDLLTKMEIDVSLGGNSFIVRRPGPMLARLRPDWMDIIIGGPQGGADDPVKAWAVDARPVGYMYTPGGRLSGNEPTFFLPEEVAHYTTMPDPEAQFRGISWLTPVINDIAADAAMTAFKDTFFNHSATPNLVVKMNVEDLEKFTAYVEKFREDHEGVENFGKTLFLAAGMDATPVGANLEQVQFKITQGAGETRLASAAGVPPVIAGFSEGLQAATYSNYSQARRRFADGTIRPLWGFAAGALASIVDVPPDAELWYDESGISFLKEDLKDAAEIQGLESRTIRTLLDAGFVAKSVIAATVAGDWTLLEHSGLFSVQLQPPGTKLETGTPTPNQNGSAARALELEEVEYRVRQLERGGGS